jgi:hypothetical protein
MSIMLIPSLFLIERPAYFGLIAPGAGRSTFSTTVKPSLFQSRMPQNGPAL